MTTASIAIISVNYKTSDLAIESIKSVQAQRQCVPNLRMYVIDNASNDGSFQKLSEFASNLNWVTVVDAGINGGYAAGNNIALRMLNESDNKPDLVWFLNPDTCLRDGATEALVAYLLDNNVTVVGSRLEDADGTPQISNFNFPGALSEFSAGARLGFIDRILKSKLVRRDITDQPEQCDWLAGASLMMSWQVIEDIGFMDDNYFLYFEELDYCLAAQRAGHPCWYVPASRVYHAVGASTGISDKRKAAPRRPKYWFDSRRRYYLKNFGAFKLILADFLFILGYGTWVSRAILFSKSELEREPPQFLRDFIKNSFLLRGFS